MAIYEPTMANGTAVHAGNLYVADGIVKISAIGTTLVPATVSDLKTAWNATTIKLCDAANRRTAFPDTKLDIFET